MNLYPRLSSLLRTADWTAADVVALGAEPGIVVVPIRRATLAGDAGDNRVREAKVDDRVDVIISGDADLLSLRE